MNMLDTRLFAPEESHRSSGGGTSISQTTDINFFLKMMTDSDASDIHVTTGQRPSIKVHGLHYQLQTIDPLSEQTVYSLIDQLMTNSGYKIEDFKADQRSNVDFAASSEDHGRFRVIAAYAQGQPFFVARQLPKKIYSPDQIGIPQQLIDNISVTNNGLYLVTGVTGSGKTTTLASIVQHILDTKKQVIVSIEDPTEFIFKTSAEEELASSPDWKRSGKVIAIEVGRDIPTFKQGLKNALREAPDVILVGELRDQETMEMALQAAETGHMVLSTLHTSSAADSIARIVNEFPEGRHSSVRASIANNVKAILSQKLLPNTDGTGRVAAIEFMQMTDSFQALIRTDKDGSKTSQISDKIRAGKDQGMRLMDDSIRILLAQGKIDEAVARQAAIDKAAFL